MAVLWPYALVLAVGLFVLMPKLGAYGLWDPWEPKYAESAREMIERDSFIVPYYRDDVRLTKPILVYWGILAGAAVFGLNEFGARIVGVAMALATLAGVFYVVSRLRGRLAGLVCALVLCSVPQFYFIARQSMPDVYLFTSVGMALLFFSLGLLAPDERRDWHFGASYACIALAVLAKGPVIVGTIFLTTLAIWAVIQVDARQFWLAERRRETLRFAGQAISSALALAGLSLSAYLFGTAPRWWAYSESSLESVSQFRARIAEAFGRLRLAEALLILVGIGAAAVTLRALRPGSRAVGRAALAALAAVAAALSLVTGDATSRIFAASLLASIGCVYVIVTSTRRFARQPWLWPALRPWAREVGRQTLLFLVVFLAVAGPWHVAILLQQNSGYVTDFIIKHNISRAGDAVNRSGDSDFYLRVLIFGFFPWSCFIPVALAALVGWWDRSVLKRHGLEIFLLIACSVIFSAFTISATKFSHYLAPLVVPLSVLVGLAVARTIEERHSPASRLAWIVAAMLFLLPTLDILAEDGATNLVESFTMKRWVPESLAPGPVYKGLLVGIGACLGASILVRSRLLLGGLLVAATLLAHHNTATFVPALSPHKTMKHLCESWKRLAPGGAAPIGFFGDLKHGVFFYTEQRIETLGSRQRFQEFMNPARPAFCIVERESLPALQNSYRALHRGQELSVVDKTHFQYVLISNSGQSAP